MTTIRDAFRRHGLVRPRRGRVIAGVCRGLADKIGMSAWLVRLIAVVSVVLPGPQLVAYVALWILMPSDR
jgi:phage shock protein PspC (stress-responsive transcriptional regulator)